MPSVSHACSSFIVTAFLTELDSPSLSSYLPQSWTIIGILLHFHPLLLPQSELPAHRRPLRLWSFAKEVPSPRESYSIALTERFTNFVSRSSRSMISCLMESAAEELDRGRFRDCSLLDGTLKLLDSCFKTLVQLVGMALFRWSGDLILRTCALPALKVPSSSKTIFLCAGASTTWLRTWLLSKALVAFCSCYQPYPSLLS